MVSSISPGTAVPKTQPKPAASPAKTTQAPAAKSTPPGAKAVSAPAAKAVAPAAKAVAAPGAKAVASTSTAKATSTTGGAANSGGTLINPLNGPLTITSDFGHRAAPGVAGATTDHKGLDLKAATGDPIKAAAGGKVVFAGPAGTAGNLTTIDSGNGVVTKYMHQSEIDVQVGQQV